MAIPVEAGAATAAESARAGRKAAAMRALLWLLLGGWIGSWFCFALVVAPIAFRVLPSSAVAGALVAPVLETLHLYGAVAGLLLAAIALGLRRGALPVVLPLVMAAACLYSQFGVSGELAEIREQAFGPTGNELATARFAHLHRVSMAIFSAVLLAALALLGWHVAEDVRSAR
jgi:hypothetical protein